MKYKLHSDYIFDPKGKTLAEFESFCAGKGLEKDKMKELLFNTALKKNYLIFFKPVFDYTIYRIESFTYSFITRYDFNNVYEII